MLKSDFKNIKKIIYVISFVLLFLLFIILMLFTMDSKKIIDIKDFINAGTKVIYVTENENLDYPAKILDKYDIDYLKINSKKLTIFERKKLKKILNNVYLNNILVIYKNGKIVDTIVKYKNQKIVNEFLQSNNIIPSKIVDNVEEIVNNSEKILDSKYSMFYIPYKYLDEIDKQNNIFKDIAEDYSIEYNKIDAYLLSNTQQENLNKLLGLSMVEDQILVLIKDNKMIANIRGIHSKNTYIEKLYSVNFINELENKINQVDYDEFSNLLESKERNIILLGSSEKKDVKDVINLLNEMIYNYDIKVSFINIDEDDSNLNKKIKESLEKIGYEGSFSFPLVVITEANKVLGYAIGNSKEEYFIDIFIENGVIKGDVIDEK